MPDPTAQRHLTPNPCNPEEATEEAATASLPCRADWLSMRKAETPPQRRTAGLRESAISRKT